MNYSILTSGWKSGFSSDSASTGWTGSGGGVGVVGAGGGGGLSTQVSAHPSKQHRPLAGQSDNRENIKILVGLSNCRFVSLKSGQIFPLF